MREALKRCDFQGLELGSDGSGFQMGVLSGFMPYSLTLIFCVNSSLDKFSSVGALDFSFSNLRACIGSVQMCK